jgi:hypothetical protein
VSFQHCNASGAFEHTDSQAPRLRKLSADWSKTVAFERSFFNNQCLVNDARLRALGERIRTLRRARKLSQEQFAEAGQFHRTFAGAIERITEGILTANDNSGKNECNVQTAERNGRGGQI